MNTHNALTKGGSFFFTTLLETLFNPFPNKDASTADGFWKHCATMFSTLFNNYTYIFRAFPCFCLVVFKVVCCTFVVCAKGLTFLMSNLSFSNWFQLYSIIILSSFWPDVFKIICYKFVTSVKSGVNPFPHTTIQQQTTLKT